MLLAAICLNIWQFLRIQKVEVGVLHQGFHCLPELKNGHLVAIKTRQDHPNAAVVGALA